MPRHLILVKHSLPTIQPQVPANQWQLSPEGQQRCTALANRLSVYQPFRLYSSLEPKAAQTAALVARRLGLPWQTHPGLHEHERSRESFSTNEQFQSNVQNFFDHPAEIVLGDESADQAHQRFAAAVQSLVGASQHADDSLVVVAHGTVISLFVSRGCGLPGFPLWKELGLPSYIALSWPGDRFQIVEIVPNLNQ